MTHPQQREEPRAEEHGGWIADGIVGLALVGSLGVTMAVAWAAESAPDATLELKGGSVGVGIGFSWGSGTLTYKGKQYPVAVDGFDVGDVGITNVTASAKIYNLQNGVKVDLVSTTQGVKLALAVGDVKMQIKQ